MEDTHIPNVYEYGDMNFTDMEPHPVTLSGMFLASLISAIVMFLFNGFLLFVIVQDRCSYRKAKCLASLNYILNYAFFALFYYFYTVHIHMYPDMPRSSCAFIIFLYLVLEDGTKYFIFPLCIDFIVQHFMPNQHQKRKFIYFQLILIGGIWGVIFLKEIALSSSQPENEIPFCIVMLSDVIIYSQLICTILFLCAVVVCLSLLLYIAIRNEEKPWKSFNVMGAVAVISVLLIVVHVISMSSTITMLAFIDSNGNNNSMAKTSSIVHFIGSLLIPFAWLCDGAIRQSIWKLFTGKRSTPENQTVNELTTEID
ncbi:uncharacterized protein LOC115220990 [Octopus sinensis]|uniref:Uncharacterized protein LOC115220990 n=1 Tax=Octopus sinensis TaxID=2607531 RepID=A0A6P7T807_9MOLL|nr:uncharacterized protein LOC115220990 [Octopus sinensis]